MTAVGTIEASAPGKLFLLGEYAVLHGAPALLTAVDRRARVTVSGANGAGANRAGSASNAPGDARWRVSAPAIGIPMCVLESDGGLPAGLDQSTRDRLRVFDAVRRAVARLAVSASAAPSPTGLTITIDTDSFWHSGHKLGLGSSAAVAVALTTALAAAHGLHLTTDQLRTCATDAHRESQGGTGSGGDVAASCSGGLITFSREPPATEPVAVPGATVSGATVSGAAPIPQVWPRDLDLRVVTTGTGSSSTELVGRVAEYGRRDPSGCAADLDRLAALAGRATAALASADAFLALADAYFDALVALDTHARAGIVTEQHQRLHAVVSAHGGVFKTSGAGGGDVGLVFARSGADASRVAAALVDAGVELIPLAFGAPGVRIDTDTEGAS